MTGCDEKTFEDEYQFAQETTCHGCNRFCNDWNKFRRLLWLIIVLASLGILGWQLYLRISEFILFDTKTDVEVILHNKLPLPTITICNSNMIFKSRATKMDEQLTRDVTVPLAMKLVENAFEGLGTEPHEWIEMVFNYTKEFEELEKEILTANSYNPENFTASTWLERGGWYIQPNVSSVRQPILSCAVGKQFCSAEHFKPVLTKHGLCYSFNYDDDDVPFQKMAGAGGGLKLVLDVMEDDYTEATLDLDLHTGSGLKIMIHDWFEAPNPDTAVDVPTGGSNNVQIEKSVRKSTDMYPWGSCESNTNGSDIPYSRRNCLLACQTRVTIEICGCRLWYEYVDASIGDVPECGIAVSTSCMMVKETVGDTLHSNCIESCSESCEETTYRVSSSFTRLVSKHTRETYEAKVTLLKLMQNIKEVIAGTRSADTEFKIMENVTAEFVENNIVHVHIGYSRFQTTVSTSTPAQTPSSFVSDIGGQLGLFAGMSMITVCEFIEHPFVKLGLLIRGSPPASGS